MTVEKMIKVFQDNRIPIDTELLSNSGWECSATETDGIFYNPDKKCIELTQGSKYDLIDYVGWKCLSLKVSENNRRYYDSIHEFYIEPETLIVKKREFNSVCWLQFALDTRANYHMTVIYDGLNKNDNVINCPECGGSIYEDDYPNIAIDIDGDYVCPICKGKIVKEVK